jgi:hypothetical protein
MGAQKERLVKLLSFPTFPCRPQYDQFGKLTELHRAEPWYGSAWRFAGVLLTLLTTELPIQGSQKD